MSKWTEKAKSVRSQGEIQRRDWNPRPGSVHLRMYQWWQTKSSRAKDISRENFCHYWRVVMIWAPLRWAWPRALVLLGVAFVVVLLVDTFVYGSGAAIVVFTAIYMMFSLFIVLVVTSAVFLDSQEDSSIRTRVSELFGDVWMCVSMLIAVPAVVATCCVALIIASVRYITKKLHGYYGTSVHWQAFGKYIARITKATVMGVGTGVEWFFTARFSDSLWLTWIRPYLVVPATFAILGYWYSWALTPAIAIAALVTLVMAVLCIAYFADKAMAGADETLADLIKSEHDVFFHNLFALQHPKYANDEARYQRWFTRYSRYIRNEYYCDVHDGFTPISFLLSCNDTLERKYEERYGKLRGSTVWEYTVHIGWLPGGGSKKKRRSGVVEFLAFVWSVVLVNKWKICPIVEIPEKS